MLKKYLHNLYINAENLNTKNVMEALKSTGKHQKLLDVGCWDGIASQDWIKASGASVVYGIEPIESAAREADSRGIKTLVIQADKEKWPLEDNSLDCIVSNQVIEHLSDLDHFFSEAHRVLKPNGYLITSTNNLSSLHNIISIILGYAPFDLTNCSNKKSGVGNPFAIHRNEVDERGSSWTHKCVYTPYWLGDWQKSHGFKFLNYLGAGMYPFPAYFGKIFKKHSAFITTICQKK